MNVDTNLPTVIPAPLGPGDVPHLFASATTSRDVAQRFRHGQLG